MLIKKNVSCILDLIGVSYIVPGFTLDLFEETG